MKVQIHLQGTRVRIRPGRFPIDPELVGRSGTVLTFEGMDGVKYGVQLDGEERIRIFLEEELHPLEAPGPGNDGAPGGTGEGPGPG